MYNPNQSLTLPLSYNFKANPTKLKPNENVITSCLICIRMEPNRN